MHNSFAKDRPYDNRRYEEVNHQCKYGCKLDIPDFHDDVQSEKLIDWFIFADESGDSYDQLKDFVGEPVYNVYGDGLSMEPVYYGDPIFRVGDDEDQSYDAYEGEDVGLFEVEVIKNAKYLEFSPQYGATREAFHASYKTNQKEEDIPVGNSKTEFTNWVFGKEDPIRNSSYRLGILKHICKRKQDSFIYLANRQPRIKSEPLDHDQSR